MSLPSERTGNLPAGSGLGGLSGSLVGTWAETEASSHLFHRFLLSSQSRPSPEGAVKTPAQSKPKDIGTEDRNPDSTLSCGTRQGSEVSLVSQWKMWVCRVGASVCEYVCVCVAQTAWAEDERRGE